MGTNLLKRGAEWLARQIQRHASQEICYCRGLSTLYLRAALGRTELAIDDGEGGMRIEHTDRDFIVPAHQLVFAGELAEPRVGDRITVVEDDGRYDQVYEVMAPAGQQPYRLCDSHGVLIRVHAKRVQ